MSTSKITRAAQNLLQQISRMAQTLTKGLVRWLLRGLIIIGRKPIASTAGFVLPTTVLLLLVITLTVGAIGFRTYTRSQQAIGERQQRVIYNAATPAVDRAKAKLEFMFNNNRDRRSGGVPGEKQLMGMMLNDGSNDVPRFPASGPDPYTFPNEDRIDIDKDGKKDNAWKYETEDASGRKSLVVYSILFSSPRANQPTLTLRDTTKETLEKRAEELLIRNAPLSNNAQIDPNCVRNTGDEAGTSLLSEDGWFEDQSDSTKLRKNFQVDAYVLPLDSNGNPDPNSTVATLEFQQDREATQGFRWAAWFRNDMEIFPGPDFNWNGAMHTQGSYFLASDAVGSDSAKFKAFMVSAPNSCLYLENASTITTPTIKADPDKNQPYFQGQFIAGEMRKNEFTGTSSIDVWDGEKRPPLRPNNVPLFNTGSDSVGDTSGLKPVDFALDPITLHTQDVTQGRTITNPGSKQTTGWESSVLGKRLKNQVVPQPYLDDTFRADNRYGPKPTLDESGKPLPVDIGTTIVGDDRLTNEKEGLDGYWERRARTDGMRIIVGQRLELGDPAGWGGPTTGESGDTDSITAGNDTNDIAYLQNEPLRPWAPPTADEKGCTGSRCNEARQRRTLWDNLAAVQATAVYHKAMGETNLDYPAACIATTVHPGTAGTLDKSATFENLAFGFKDAFAAPYNVDGRVISDFFRGRGTNGWEYTLPSLAELKNPNSGLVKALHNLAYFAGDPLGGAPSFTPIQSSGSQGAFPHPFPSMAMWGDFSMLRRVLGTSYSGATYDALSMADKTTLHTSACLLSMLAYNLDYLNKFDYNSSAIAALLGTNNTSNFDGLRGHIRAIDTVINDPLTSGGIISLLSMPLEISTIKKQAMEAMSWIKTDAGSTGSNDPETYVRLLEFWRDAAPDDSFKEQLTKEIALARLIITKEQVERDRKFGFGGSYALSPKRYLSNQCNAWYDGQSAGSNSYKDAAKAEPLMRLCSDRPRYPVLFSLFPVFDHGDVGDISPVSALYPSSTTLDPTWAGQKVRLLVRDQEDNNTITTTDSEKNHNYITAGAINKNITYKTISDSEIANMAAKPKTLGGMGFGGTWTLPTQGVADGRTPTALVSGAEKYDLVKVCPATGDWKNVVCSRAENLTAPVTESGGITNFDGLRPVSGPRFRVPFKDSAFMNGRELMSVRSLNLDLDLMRRSTFGSDYWLPKSGIIYAYREDAVSESHIVRPTTKLWANCDTLNELVASGCVMNTQKVSALNSKDPPINDRNISPKPVDFFADPDRRPYGFRLRNGAALWRGSLNGSVIADAADPPGRGLSFISHNPIYVQGYFNLHRPAGETSLDKTKSIEEFDEKLTNTPFYNRSKLNENFADRKKDQWRPAEVLGDAVTLLSTNFCDGSIEDGLVTSAISNGTNNGLLTGFVNERYGCSNSGDRTSYLNQPRPNKTIGAINKVVWMRSSIVDSYWRASFDNNTLALNTPWGRAESPIYVFRYGHPMSIMKNGADVRINDYPGTGNTEAGTGSSDYYTEIKKKEGGLPKKDSKKDLITASDGIQMNMILISGLVPSRGGQSYGGLHNFPRFVENWNGKNLYFAGAFLQLNFSTYATSPFDQEQWEPGLDAPKDGSDPDEWFEYYNAPTRSWGFDVGLKYAPPGPVAERFRSPEPNRSEFYDEPPANDPYIELLACVANPSNPDCD